MFWDCEPQSCYAGACSGLHVSGRGLARFSSWSPALPCSCCPQARAAVPRLSAELGDAGDLRNPGRERLVRQQRHAQLGDRVPSVPGSTVATRGRSRPTRSVRSFTCDGASEWTRWTRMTTKTVRIKRDVTRADSHASAPDRAPDSNGWYNRPLTVTFIGTDATSRDRRLQPGDVRRSGQSEHLGQRLVPRQRRKPDRGQLRAQI